MKFTRKRWLNKKKEPLPRARLGARERRAGGTEPMRPRLFCCSSCFQQRRSRCNAALRGTPILPKPVKLFQRSSAVRRFRLEVSRVLSWIEMPPKCCDRRVGANATFISRFIVRSEDFGSWRRRADDSILRYSSKCAHFYSSMQFSFLQNMLNLQ